MPAQNTVVGRFAISGAVLTLAVALSAVPSVARARSAPLAPRHQQAHLMRPALAADAHGHQLLAGVSLDGTRVISWLRKGHGGWKHRKVLTGPGEDVLMPSAAMSANGWAVVAWADGIGGPLHLRLRRPGHRWQQEKVFSQVHVYGAPQVAVNGHGEVVAAPDAESGDRHLVVRRHGKWRVVRCPLYGGDVVGMDRDGAVIAAATEVQRGGEGDVTAARFGPGGHWSKVRSVPLPDSVQDVQLSVAPNGAIALAGGYVSPHWRSTHDTELYWPTAYRVIGTDHWGGAWHRVWQRDGVPQVSLSRAGQQVQVTWEQWLDPQKRRPTRRELLTQRIAPSPGTVVKIAGGATSKATSSYLIRSALRDSGRADVAWRSQIASQRTADRVHAVAVSPRGKVRATALAASRARDWYDTAPAIAPDGTVAWVAHTRERHTRDFGWVLTKSAVATARVTLR